MQQLQAQRIASGKACGTSRSVPVPVGLGRRCLPAHVALSSARPAKLSRGDSVRARATEDAVEVRPVSGSAGAEEEENDWVPVCKPEDLPKGLRKEFEVMGRRVLMFWYRNEIFAVEARSPAEGAYSEGFIQAKFTQDYCIECPSTGTLFSLRDGSIQSWYPNNPVMRVLTPSSYCRPMAVYPVHLGSDAISVDVTSGRGGRAMGRGGAGTSLENNNVFSVQPTVYFEGMDPNKEAASLYADEKMVPSQQNPVVILTGIVALGATAVAGTAISIYFESLPALIGTWVSLGGAAVFYGYNYVNERAKKDA